MAVLLLLCSFAILPALARGGKCAHCSSEEAFSDLLRPDIKKSSAKGAADADDADSGPYTDVHVMWPAHVEVIPVTVENGGFEPPSFHEKLAKEAIRGWRSFRDDIGPKLPSQHSLRQFLSQSHAGALNDGFFHFQKRLFEFQGDFDAALRPEYHMPPTPPPDANSSWPEMNALPEYKKLRQIVEKFSRRYLIRSGLAPSTAHALNYSIFNWAAVHGPGEFHGPHTHVGEFHVGVFYAQVGPSAGKLRFGDPRGHSPPFGRTFFHTPRAGDLVFFPSWLSHMATVTAPTSDIREGSNKDEPYRVVFSFNIGPVSGPLPCHLWWSDPTGDMRFRRRTRVDLKGMGLA